MKTRSENIETLKSEFVAKLEALGVKYTVLLVDPAAEQMAITGAANFRRPWLAEYIATLCKTEEELQQLCTWVREVREANATDNAKIS